MSLKQDMGGAMKESKVNLCRCAKENKTKC